MLRIVSRCGMVVLLSLGASSAQAQIAASLDEIRFLVDVGDPILVKSSSGEDVTGELVRVSNGVLLLDSAGRQRAFRETEVVRVVQTQQDSFKNGVLLGMAIGAVVGGVVAYGCDSQYCPGWIKAAIPAYGLGFGAGIGVGFDAIFRTPTVIFDRMDQAARVHLSPIVAPSRRGLQVTMTF